MAGRTLVVTNDYPPRPGGIQSFVQGLISRLPPDDVVVYASAWKGDTDFDGEQPFEVIRHPTSLMVPDPLTRRNATRLLRDTGADRVLFGAAAPLGLLGKPLRRAGAENIVALTHGHEAGWAGIPGGSSILRAIGGRVDTMTYLGEYTRRRIGKALRPADADRMRRLVPGVDTDVFNPANVTDGQEIRRRHHLADRPVIVCVSRLMPRKGQDTLIRVLPAVAAVVPGVALLLVGGGPYRANLERLVADASLSDRVIITGSVPWAELPAHYAAGDVFAMPCRTRNRGLDVEGLGIVYLEASATGLPVIAGTSGGAPDAVVPGETGFIVDPADDAALVAQLIDLLTDPDRARRIGRQGRAWIEENWEWPTLVNRLQDLLDGRDPDAAT